MTRILGDWRLGKWAAAFFILSAGSLAACSGGGEQAVDFEPSPTLQAGASRTLETRTLKRGERGSLVREAYLHLKRYGYFPNPELEHFPGWRPALSVEPSDPEAFDQVMEEAVRLFQAAHGLTVDGTLNAATQRLIRTPRCGFPDSLASPSPAGSGSFAYLGSRWSTPNLTYQFINYTSDLPSGRARAALIGALQRWEAATTFNFREVGAGGDLLIGWYAGDHGDGNHFDGPGNVLAHAYSPTSGLGGDVHFDEAEHWTDSGAGGTDLPSVALHELGHALGLAHSSDGNAVMYAYYSGPRRDLTADDVSGIQSIYGVRAVASWSSSGPIAGKYCTQITESADPHTWLDNYFCTDTYQGVRWSSAGPIPGMRCTQIAESADPYTWLDNYLCVPTTSSFSFAWSASGPILGRRCVQWTEWADPHTWNDNFLCY